MAFWCFLDKIFILWMKDTILEECAAGITNGTGGYCNNYTLIVVNELYFRQFDV